jgi:predicted enzyme related to lactoylglutathione lyase
VGKKLYEDRSKFIGDNTEIIFRIEDIEETYSELKRNGVKISKPKKQKWVAGWSDFEDQDGSEYSLSQELASERSRNALSLR